MRQRATGRAHCPQCAVIEGLSASFKSIYPAQSLGPTRRLEDQPPYRAAERMTGRAHCPQCAVIEGLLASFTPFILRSLSAQRGGWGTSRPTEMRERMTGRAHCPQCAVVEGSSASFTFLHPAQSPGPTRRLEDQPPYRDAAIPCCPLPSRASRPSGIHQGPMTSP